MKKKIAFINQRYGKEVNGGSEYYTMLMVKKLSQTYEVEVLTSKALTYDHWSDYYQDSIEEIDGIKVIRFGVRHKRKRVLQKFVGKMVTWMKMNFVWLNKFLIKIQGPYVPDLIKYIQDNKQNYDAFVFVTYLYYPTVIGMPEVKEKAVFIPTAHDETCIYFKIFRGLFLMPAAFIYLTEEEKRFVHKLFGNENIPYEIAGVGIDLPDISTDRFQKKYGLKGKYIIYAGRVEKHKGVLEMFQYFNRYMLENTELTLVVIGKEYLHVPVSDKLISLGFISEEDKFDAISGAEALWLPSQYESLSIAVLEAMSLSVPVIVNGYCDVLEGHCRKSGGGISYKNYQEFCSGMKILLGSKHEEICKNAKSYVEREYSWDVIMNKWDKVLEHIFTANIK